MRRLSWMFLLVCVLSMPSWGQSRRRGYTPAGGWHRKSVPAAPVPPEKKKNDKRPLQTPPPPPSPSR